MLEQQIAMVLSPYMTLYEKLIPQDHLLRKIDQLVDFSFVEEELKDKYCIDNGRKPIPPIQMFKYILLKALYCLSDGDLIERARYDMSFKYFLGLAPEEDVIHPTSLTKFRTLRLKDKNILDMLIGKTVDIAIQEGVLKSTTIYVDSTHISSRYQGHSKSDVLLKLAKDLRRNVYQLKEGMKEKFPTKPTGKTTEETVSYCQGIVQAIRQEPGLDQIPAVKEQANYLEEVLGDLEHLKTSVDTEAQKGHKSKENHYFGYKLHLGMSDERIITAGVVTPGNEADGIHLEELVTKSREHGMKVDSVVGDAGYGNGKLIRYANGTGEEGEGPSGNFKLIAPLMISETHESKDKEGFEFNKDAGMYVCPAGHMSFKRVHQKARVGKDGEPKPAMDTYYFDIENCKYCPHKEGCYRKGSKTKTYSVTIRDMIYKEHLEHMASKESKMAYKERYKIEAKNSELKNQYDCACAIGMGLFSMRLQGAAAIFISNLRRILRLQEEKQKK